MMVMVFGALSDRRVDAADIRTIGAVFVILFGSAAIAVWHQRPANAAYELGYHDGYHEGYEAGRRAGVTVIDFSKVRHVDEQVSVGDSDAEAMLAPIDASAN